MRRRACLIPALPLHHCLSAPVPDRRKQGQPFRQALPKADCPLPRFPQERARGLAGTGPRPASTLTATTGRTLSETWRTAPSTRAQMASLSAQQRRLVASLSSPCTGVPASHKRPAIHVVHQHCPASGYREIASARSDPASTFSHSLPLRFWWRSTRSLVSPSSRFSLSVAT